MQTFGKQIKLIGSSFKTKTILSSLKFHWKCHRFLKFHRKLQKDKADLRKENLSGTVKRENTS